MAWQGIIYTNVWLNCEEDYRDVFLLAMSHWKGGSGIMRVSLTLPANWDAVSNATHLVIKASCVFCRKFFGMRKFWRGRCAEGPLDCLNWSLFRLYFIAYFCVASQFPTWGPSLFMFRKKRKKIQLGRRSNWWCRLLPKHWCEHCSHDLLFVNTDPDVGPACSEMFASCCSASIRFHLVIPCHSSRSAVLFHRVKEEVWGASKARTTSGLSQSLGSKSTSTGRHYLYIEMRAPQCPVLSTYLVKDTLHPQKLIFTIAVWESWVGIRLGFYLKCSAVRQEWWVNTRWCPTLIFTSLPLVFLGQGEMNNKDSC